MPEPLTRTVRRALAPLADAKRAVGMRAYLKSEMPCLGVPAPALRKACKELFGRVEIPSAARWRDGVLGLWRGAEFREERYAGFLLADDRRMARFRDLDALPMYEEMIVTGAWWDLVDGIASHLLGEMLRKHPREMRRAMRAWSRSENLWKRRSSIICQLGFRKETDLPLLYACIEPSLASKEFFLQKAIGWALRAHAWTDPEEVRRYVSEKGAALSALSRREALKNVGPSAVTPSAG